MAKALQLEHGVDKHLMKVIDGNNIPTALDISTNGARVVGDLEVTGTITSPTSESLDDKLSLSGGAMTGDITIAIDDKVIFGDAGEYIVGNGTDLDIISSNDLTLKTAGTGDIIFDTAGQDFKFLHQSDADDYFNIAVIKTSGETTLSTISEHSDGHINIEPQGHVQFDGCGVGFDKETTTFAAAAVTSEGDDSTDIDFRIGNKHELTLTDDIAGSGEYINIIFPATSGNFILVLIQGVADCTIDETGWRAYQSDGSTLGINTLAQNGTDGRIRWSGGSAPTLSTSQYDIDVISFYWDADNGTALGMASLDFS